MVLGLLYISAPSYAEDIHDYEIEGIKVGDNLLDHITQEQFKSWEEYKFYYKDNKFAVIPCRVESKEYEQLECTYKPKNKDINSVEAKYKIYSVSGTIKYPDNISACLKKKNEVVNEISDILKNTTKNDYGTYEHDYDSTGDSKQTVVDFDFDSGGYIRVVCHDWSDKLTKKNNWKDEFKVYITSQELSVFINK